MLISILLPTRNRQQRLSNAIASVQVQSHKDWELVILDNSDEPQKFPRDKRIRVFRVHQQPVSALFQAALERAKGEVVCHFADDDLLPPDALAKAAECIGTADWLVGGTEIRDDSGHLIAYRGGTREAVERTLGGDYWLGGGVYWRRTLSDLLGGYDVAFDGAADFEMFLRFARYSRPVIVEDVLYIHTDWPGADSRLRAANQRAMSNAIRSR